MLSTLTAIYLLPAPASGFGGLRVRYALAPGQNLLHLSGQTLGPFAILQEYGAPNGHDGVVDVCGSGSVHDQDGRAGIDVTNVEHQFQNVHFSMSAGHQDRGHVTLSDPPQDRLHVECSERH